MVVAGLVAGAHDFDAYRASEKFKNAGIISCNCIELRRGRLGSLCDYLKTGGLYAHGQANCDPTSYDGSLLCFHFGIRRTQGICAADITS